VEKLGRYYYGGLNASGTPSSRVRENTREGRRSDEATAAQGPKYLEEPGDATGALEGPLANRRRGKNYE
jgi:hypothetical protein